MKYVALIALTSIGLCFGIGFGGWFSKSRSHPEYEQLQNGDIVFQYLGGEQGKAVEAATKSKYTHCGIVFQSDDELYVLEAVQPVSVTTLKEFKNRSKIFHARRLKDPGRIDAKALQKALTWGKKQIGKDYDPLFQWDDKNLYCSELVWKIYDKSAGIRLCKARSFQSYFLDDPSVRSLIEKRYGGTSKLPAKEPVVAPSDLAASPLLEEVPHRRSKK